MTVRTPDKLTAVCIGIHVFVAAVLFSLAAIMPTFVLQAFSGFFGLLALGFGVFIFYTDCVQ